MKKPRRICEERRKPLRVKYAGYDPNSKLPVLSLRKFLLALLFRKRCGLARIVNQQSLLSVNIVLRKEEGEFPENAREDAAVQMELKESPELDDLLVLLTHTRKHSADAPENSEQRKIDTSTLTCEAIRKYLVADLACVYGRQRDPRLFAIDKGDKMGFVKRHVAALGQAGTAIKDLQFSPRELAIGFPEEEPGKARERRPYETALVNGEEYARFMDTTKYDVLGIDCEMVLTDRGAEVGRVSLVSQYRENVYDRIVLPTGAIRKYNTEYSGLRKSTFRNLCECRGCGGTDGAKCQRSVVTYREMLAELSEIIGKDTVLVGHSLAHDMCALRVFHEKLVDTSLLFGTESDYKMKLKDIMKKHFGKEIQNGEHSSTVDAASALQALALKVAKGAEYGASRLLEIDFPVPVNVIVAGAKAGLSKEAEGYLQRKAVNFWLGEGMGVRSRASCVFVEVIQRDGGPRPLTIARFF